MMMLKAEEIQVEEKVSKICSTAPSCAYEII